MHDLLAKDFTAKFDHKVDVISTVDKRILS